MVASTPQRVLTVAHRSRTPPTPRIALSDNDFHAIAERLDTLLKLIERAVPVAAAPPDFAAADAFVWHPTGKRLQPVAKVNRIEINLLKGIDRVRDLLVENTERFARGLPANNVLLW